jgi:hypothetical protein
MRYFPLLLSANIALFTVPAAAAVSADASLGAIAATCPAMEGYPDCHPDDDSGRTTHSRNASRARA